MTPFVGPSYALAASKADCQRSINLYLSQIESGTGKAAFMLKSIPGLSVFASLGASIRGTLLTAGRAFVVAGSKLYEVSAQGVATERGTLSTSTGRISMAAGVTQLVIVDGPNGYVFRLAGNTFAAITDPDFYGSRYVAFVDGYFIFIRPGTGQYYISAIDDASELDALDFATAEGNPDNLQVILADHRELWLLGENTTEIALNAGAADFPFQRNSAAFIETGVAAPDSAIKLDNSIYWLGQNEQGGGMVYRANGYQPQIISDDATNERLQTSTNLAGATAYGYQQGGKTFYCIDAPGLKTTQVYEAKSGQWHERAELVNGSYAPHRGTHFLYAFGLCLLGADDGKLYQLDPAAHSNAGDVLVRDRISPHNAGPALERLLFPRFALDCTVGKALSGQDPQVMLRYSNDGGITWGNWQTRSLGQIGEFRQRVVWHRCGMARDRTWQVRCTDDVEFDIISAVA